MQNKPYWLETPLKIGEPTLPQENSIAIIGAGLAGVSVAYWLQKLGIKDATLVDYQPEKAASLRNCGHILYGTVENIQALIALHGIEKAQKIWQFSIDICEQVKQTIKSLDLEADYHQDGYLCLAIDKAEEDELIESTRLLNELGFASEFILKEKVAAMGFKNCFGGRFEPGSASAHPVKFRNGLLEHVLRNGCRYHSGHAVMGVNEGENGVELEFADKKIKFDAAVIAANAYSPLLSQFYKDKRLLEPFRGQIITSEVLPHWQHKISMPHSFDHGYEYALWLPDQRLMLGGWRNNTPTGEIGTYDLKTNQDVELGLKEFAAKYYGLPWETKWEYSWSGIMATSKTGLPFIGPTSSPLIYTCAGFTGHGFSWAHGSGKLLAQIICGASLPEVSQFFNPCAV